MVEVPRIVWGRRRCMTASTFKQTSRSRRSTSRSPLTCGGIMSGKRRSRRLLEYARPKHGIRGLTIVSIRDVLWPHRTWTRSRHGCPDNSLPSECRISRSYSSGTQGCDGMFWHFHGLIPSPIHVEHVAQTESKYSTVYRISLQPIDRNSSSKLLPKLRRPSSRDGRSAVVSEAFSRCSMSVESIPT